jgi:putative FmdB family regulatory protein
MPFYEYVCASCGHRFDVMLTVREREEKEKSLVCPSCGAREPRRMISTFATGVTAQPTPPKRTCGGGG